MNAVMVEPKVTLPTTPLAKNFLTPEHLPFFAHLNPMVRVLLVSDGNLTNMLQAYFLEAIDLRLVTQNRSYHASEFETGGIFLRRQVVLYGKKSLRPYVYAESRLALDDLPLEFARDLEQTDLPLGRLWLHHRLETFKELLDVSITTHETASGHLGKDGSSPLLKRSYRVISRGRPCMVIHEYFPLAGED
jgi:chorismate-pyruvate lyase